VPHVDHTTEFGSDLAAVPLHAAIDSAIAAAAPIAISRLDFENIQVPLSVTVVPVFCIQKTHLSR
jgi:hypothetical protein